MKSFSVLIQRIVNFTEVWFCTIISKQLRHWIPKIKKNRSLVQKFGHKKEEKIVCLKPASYSPHSQRYLNVEPLLIFNYFILSFILFTEKQLLPYRICYQIVPVIHAKNMTISRQIIQVFTKSQWLVIFNLFGFILNL